MTYPIQHSNNYDYTKDSNNSIIDHFDIRHIFDKKSMIITRSKNHDLIQVSVHYEENLIDIRISRLFGFYGSWGTDMITLQMNHREFGSAYNTIYETMCIR